MAKQRPTIYLDTNILSVLNYRGAHVGPLHQQMLTRRWWDAERKHFRLYVSSAVDDELRAGQFPGQSTAVALAERLPHLHVTTAVLECAGVFVDSKLVPRTKPGDALHLATATVRRMDYLMTWNHAHLANLHVQHKLDEVCQRHGWRPPYLVSPETIPHLSLGQSIRRHDS